jgi:hypothetical protein
LPRFPISMILFSMQFSFLLFVFTGK